MAIRYDKELNREINRTIKNFNQKIARLERQERELLPSKVTKKQLQSYETRADLKKKLKEMQRFTKRGAEEVITTKGGARITQFELKNLKQDLKVQKQKLTRELTRLKTQKPTVFGKSQGFTFAQMGSQEYLNKKAQREILDKNVEEMNQKQLEKVKERVDKMKKPDSQAEQTFKDNYISMLFTLAYFTDYSNNKLFEIADVFYQLDKNQFVNLFNTDMAIRAILEYYPFVTGKYKGMNPDVIRDEVWELYDELYNHLDYIKREYLKENA